MSQPLIDDLSEAQKSKVFERWAESHKADEAIEDKVKFILELQDRVDKELAKRIGLTIVDAQVEIPEDSELEQALSRVDLTAAGNQTAAIIIGKTVIEPNAQIHGSPMIINSKIERQSSHYSLGHENMLSGNGVIIDGSTLRCVSVTDSTIVRSTLVDCAVHFSNLTDVDVWNTTFNKANIFDAEGSAGVRPISGVQKHVYIARAGEQVFMNPKFLRNSNSTW